MAGFHFHDFCLCYVATQRDTFVQVFINYMSEKKSHLKFD